MRFTTVGDVRLSVPPGFDIDRWTMERVPGESDDEFEAAKAAYRKMFKVHDRTTPTDEDAS